jgi:hypothetical protein
MVEAVVLIAMVLTAVLALGLSYIPAIWGAVFSFTAGVVAILTGGAVMFASMRVDEYVIWALISFSIVAVAWANILRINMKRVETQ